MPHPGHQICGIRSIRRNSSTVITTGPVTVVRFSIAMKTHSLEKERGPASVRSVEALRLFAPIPATTTRLWNRISSGVITARETTCTLTSGDVDGILRSSGKRSLLIRMLGSRIVTSPPVRMERAV